MNSTKRSALTILVLGLAAAALAGGLSKKYKNWPKSPEAYFLTSEEKAAWKNVKTDEAAQQFIQDYRAKRGPDFEKVLTERVAAADKYFSSGSTKGSETLRGKVIIVFGPPSGVELSAAKGKLAGVDPNNQGTTGGGSSGGIETSSFGAGPLSPHDSAAEAPQTFTISYDKSDAPRAIGKPFKVEL